MPKLPLILSAALLLAGGCLFEPYRPTAVFDLNAAPVAISRPVRVSELLNNSSSGSRLQTRFADGRLVADPYNRWAMPPGELVANALNRAFATRGVTTPLPVSGAIEIFETDDAAKQFRLAGFLTLPDRGTSEFRFDITVPVEGDSAEAVAAAASQAVRNLAELLAGAAAAERER